MADEPEKTPAEEKHEKAAKSTVRAAKKAPKGATQRFLPIAEIRDDTVVLKNGGLRAILQVQALNFNLKSETEQQGIIAGFESFLNTLTFPIQIVVRSTRMNIDPYITRLRAMAETQKNELLKEQTLAYADFVGKIVEIAEIMQKKFYVVIPLDDTVEQKSTFAQIFAWFGGEDTPAKAAARHRLFAPKSAKLRERVNLVISGIHNVGLMSQRLETHELVELFYQIYNPKTSQEQRLPSEGALNVEELVL